MEQQQTKEKQTEEEQVKEERRQLKELREQINKAKASGNAAYLYVGRPICKSNIDALKKQGYQITDTAGIYIIKYKTA